MRQGAWGTADRAEAGGGDAHAVIALIDRVGVAGLRGAALGRLDHQHAARQGLSPP